MKHPWVPALLLVLAGTLCWVPARAGKHRGPDHRAPPAEPRAMEREGPLSLEEAVSRVRRKYGGRVLSARKRGGDYQVRVLTPGGRVKRFRLDPRTGRFR